MKHVHLTRIATLFALSSSLALAGCSDAGETPLELDSSQLTFSSESGAVAAMYGEQLAELREVTAPYHNFNAAYDAGYVVKATPCWYYPGSGAMGFHYLNPENLSDDVDLLKPQALVYEPKKNGGLRLVALEYIVFYSEAWPEGGDPPMLLGQQFTPSADLPLFALHIWLWRNNPNGMFADWNPKVSCQYTDDTEDRSMVGAG